MRNFMRILKFAFLFIGLLWLAGQVTSHKPAALVPVAQAASNLDCTAVSEIPVAECEALVTFYTQTDGPHWGANYNWLTTITPCAWYGVACQNQHVVSLALSTVDLRGTLPAALGELPQLQDLMIHAAHQLTGTIPPELGKLYNLRRLAISECQLQGPIPKELGQLVNLEGLSLDFNQLSGTIPPELYQLTKLTSLGLMGNQLEGTLAPELAALVNLQTLNLGGNRFQGTIPPELGSLAQLEQLTLYYNQLSGSIPAQLGELRRLRYLTFTANQLSGEVPPQLVNLVNLHERGLALGYNMLIVKDPALQTLLDQREPKWAATQTVAPTRLTAWFDGPEHIRVTWEPIAYQADGGYYAIELATGAAGAFQLQGVTTDKQTNTYLIAQPPLADEYTVRVRTYTPAHGDQVNHLWSDYAVVQVFPGGQLHGQVVGSAGPLPMIVVTLEQSNTADANGPWAVVGTTQTNDQGNYAFGRLSAGRYRVQAVDPSGRYAMAYYNISPAPATFTALDLQDGETRAGIDLFLYRTGLIRGIVTNLQGEPLQNIRVGAMRYITGTGGDGYENGGEVLTDAAGGYVLENLPAGLYRAMFFDPAQVYVTEYNNDAFTHYTAPLLRVDEGGILLGIDAAMGRPATLRGRVTTEAGEPLTGIWVSPWWRDERDGTFQYELSGFAETDASGQYTLAVSTRGLHRIGFLDSTEKYQTEFYDNRATLEEALDITVTPELLLTGIDAALAPTHPITPSARFAFTKTVGISGLQPACSTTSMIRAPVGAEVAYCYTLRNTSQVILTNHTLVDDQLGLLLAQMPQELAPGAIYSLIVRTTVSLSTTNVATWTAQIGRPLQTPAAQPALIEQTASATVHISSANDDLDHDAIPDNLEGAADIDQDNQPNYLDQDADNDGWSDEQEAGADPLHPRDSNNDGWPDYLDVQTPRGNSGYPYRSFVPFLQNGGQ
ncbi:MAG: hypothetical protein DYG89_29195 [Caldilinea sp. CFX5]|nr:hypothetical protein [Caldilinea sp. CFX5]